MSGLVLKLAPGERVLINGAVIENGDRRTRISIKTPNTNILRLKDAIHPDEADTPVRRTCYVAQLALAGDAEPHKARRELLIGIEQLSMVLQDPESHAVLTQAASKAMDDDFYAAFKSLRQLVPHEDRLLARVSG